MPAKLHFLSVAVVAVALAGCAPRPEPAPPIYAEPVFDKVGGATCPEGTYPVRTSTVPPRLVCQVPPDDCDDPFWSNQTSVPPPEQCLPPRFPDPGDDDDDRRPDPQRPAGTAPTRP